MTIQSDSSNSNSLWWRLGLAAMALLIGIVYTAPVSASEAEIDALAAGEMISISPFLSAPYSNSAVEIQQGYICHWEACEETYGEAIHGGIDYILRATPFYWISFDVLAAADGVAACFPPSDGYGYHVLITHAIEGVEYTTLYAHLADCDAFVDEAAWVQVGRGDIIGEVMLDEVTFETHLHFAVYSGSAENILGAIYSPPHTHTLLIDPYNQYSTLSNGSYDMSNSVTNLWLSQSPIPVETPITAGHAPCLTSTVDLSVTSSCSNRQLFQDARFFLIW